jgi:hypothetical protein
MTDALSVIPAASRRPGGVRRIVVRLAVIVVVSVALAGVGYRVIDRSVPGGVRLIIAPNARDSQLEGLIQDLERDPRVETVARRSSDEDSELEVKTRSSRQARSLAADIASGAIRSADSVVAGVVMKGRLEVLAGMLE